MTQELKAAAREAWLYALPLIEVAVTRDNIVRQGGKLNRFNHVTALADHRVRFVTTPNCDTLYSSAHIDLSEGPVSLSLPASGARYLSVALMDAYTNNFAVLGTRTTGPDGGSFTLIGPDAAAPKTGFVVRSPTARVWALARTGVSSAADLQAARAVQSGLVLHGPDVQPKPISATRAASFRDYFASVSALLAVDRPPATDLALLRRVGALQLESFDAARFSSDESAAIEAGVQEAKEIVRGAGAAGHAVDGWFYPGADLGNFHQNYVFRAVIALAALAALPNEEAVYLRAAGPDHGLYDGTKTWRLRFPAGGLPPAHSFWSLSLYEATPDGQFFFTDNPIDRYAIGDRTVGLQYDSDGALEIVIAPDSPGEGVNWLPSPRGPFALFLRAYFPDPKLLNGGYRVPPVTEDTRLRRPG